MKNVFAAIGVTVVFFLTMYGAMKFLNDAYVGMNTKPSTSSQEGKQHVTTL